MYQVSIIEWVSRKKEILPPSKETTPKKETPARGPLCFFVRDWANPRSFLHIQVSRTDVKPDEVSPVRQMEDLVRGYLGASAQLHRQVKGRIILATNAALWPTPNLGGPATCAIDEFSFSPDAHLDAELQLADDYDRWLKTNKQEVDLSLWVQDQEDPRHMFHVLLFKSAFGPESRDLWSGTIRYEYASHPHIEAGSVRHRAADVIDCTGGVVERVRLKETASAR